jgi:hypothetical protein
LERANSRGVWPDVAKLTEEKEIPPEETSGTPERVVREVSQVMRLAISLAMSAVSSGRAWLPMMKQAEEV